MHALRAIIVCVFSLSLLGCVSIGGFDNSDDAPPPVFQGKLQAGDRLKIVVFGEERISGDYDIDPSGKVSLPLAGTVEAAGLTKNELEERLAKKFKSEYLRDPKVTVDIATFRPFYVLGEVEKPGEYPYKSGLNVLSAIAVAGGQTYRASSSTVMIQRAGETQLREFSMSPDVLVYPGDLIRVPARYF